MIRASIRIAIVAAAGLALFACASPSAVGEQFRDHAARQYDADVVELIGIVERRTPEGKPRYHAAGAVPDEQGHGWRLVWADFSRSGRRQWTPTAWPREPYPRCATLEEARALGKKYLRRFKAGEVRAGEILDGQVLAP